MQTDHDEIEYVSTGAAARILGYTDTRSVIRLIDMGEITGYRAPGGHWRLVKADVVAARDRFRNVPAAS